MPESVHAYSPSQDFDSFEDTASLRVFSCNGRLSDGTIHLTNDRQ